MAPRLGASVNLVQVLLTAGIIVADVVGAGILAMPVVLSSSQFLG